MNGEFEQNDKAFKELPELEPAAPALPGPAPGPRRGRPFSLWMAGLALVLIGSMLGSLMTLAIMDRMPVVQAAPPPVEAAQVASDMQAGGTAAGLTGALDPYSVIPSIYKRAAPSVVSIAVVSRTVVRGFFGEQVEQRQQGEGSGFIIDPAGYIVTNNHVVAGATEIRVRLHDGVELNGQVVGTDPGNDLAIVKVDPGPLKLTALPLGDSEAVEIGDLAIAVGHPFRLPQTVTAGIISGKERTMEATGRKPIRNLLQTDAAINPGNSGGPLLNRFGEVIGVNTAIESPVRGNVGIGFAVPVNTLRRLLPSLKEGKAVEHPWLGVSIETVTPALAQRHNLPIDYGVLVHLVADKSPAEKAGIRSAAFTRREEIVAVDIITHLGGRPIRKADELISEIERRSVGDRLELTVRRGDQVIQVTAVLEAWPEELRRNN
jgi:S1-C subfamily serine protease